MDTDTVNIIFKAISGLYDISDYAPFISAAITKVTGMVRSNDALTDRRLCCLAAALAAMYAADMSGSQDNKFFSTAGTISASRVFPMRSICAEKLYNQMKAACSDLINPVDDFVFIHTDSKQEAST